MVSRFSTLLISSGDNTTCAVGSDTHLYCWGDNTYEQTKLIAVTQQRLSSVERIRGNLEASEAHGRAAVQGAQQVGALFLHRQVP